MTSSSSPSSSRKALTKIACNRLQKELAEWQVNSPAGFKHRVTDNLQRWVIEVAGAPGTLYAGETYQLQVDFPEHYPMEAPQVIFLHPAPMHPHIYGNGHICLALQQSNARRTMITMSGTAVTAGPRKRPGGGSMTTKCDESWLDFSGSSSYLPRLLQNGVLHGKWNA